jgi:ADP-ribosylglycohydrolase
MARAEQAGLERALTALDGLSVGDAFGERFFRPANLSMLSERGLPDPPWQTTDDTEMALGLVEVLAAHGEVLQDELAQTFARRYARDPGRGYGSGAHRILTLIGEGVPWQMASGTAFGGMGSMGNGAAMRVAPLGAYFSDDIDRLVEQAALSAQVTHMHPEGQSGAIAVALAAAYAVRRAASARPSSGREMLEHVHARTPDGDTRHGIARAWKLPPETSVVTAVQALGNGSKVISSDTVPFALWCAARHLDDFVEAMWTTVAGLGDRDTTCAIAGGIVALAAGRDCIPPEWLAARERLELTLPG